MTDYAKVTYTCDGKQYSMNVPKGTTITFTDGKPHKADGNELKLGNLPLFTHSILQNITDADGNGDYLTRSDVKALRNKDAKDNFTVTSLFNKSLDEKASSFYLASIGPSPAVKYGSDSVHVKLTDSRSQEKFAYSLPDNHKDVRHVDIKF